MSQCFGAELVKIAKRSAIVVPLLASPAFAEDMTAAVVMRDWTAQQRSMFLAGVVEGLAQARYEQDDKNPAGAKCIYDWFYSGGEDALRQVYDAFAANANSAPAAVVSALVKRECDS